MHSYGPHDSRERSLTIGERASSVPSLSSQHLHVYARITDLARIMASLEKSSCHETIVRFQDGDSSQRPGPYSKSTPFYSHSNYNNQQSSRPRDRNCHYCNKPGHIKRACRKLQDDKVRQRNQRNRN